MTMKAHARQIFALVALILSAIFGQAAQAAKGSIVPLQTVPSTAEVVKVGFYPISVYNVDASTSTFSYDGYVWFRWKGEVDPTKTVEFINAVDKSSLSRQDLFDAPQPMPDGSKYQIMRIEAQFYKPFSLADFPLDRHQLTVQIEDSVRGIDALVYDMDRADSGYGRSLTIAGWKLNGWSFARVLNDYGSNFGDATTQASRFAQISYSLNIARPESYFLWKLFLPLVIVLSGAWIALLLSPELIETRAALPATALLTTVFLQQSYTSTLPETGNLVLLDKIYVVAYILIVATLAQVIVNSRDIEDKTPAELKRIRRIDVSGLVAQVLIFLLATAGIVFMR
jgi:hypothetical protein